MFNFRQVNKDEITYVGILIYTRDNSVSNTVTGIPRFPLGSVLHLSVMNIFQIKAKHIPN